MRNVALLVICLFPVLACVPGALNWVVVAPVGSAPIDASLILDKGFGTGGYTILNVGNTEAQAAGIALQADEGIVVGGYGVGGTKGVAVVRLLADGALDPGFNGSGEVFLDVVSMEHGGPTLREEVHAVAVSPSSQNIYLVGLGKPQESAITYCLACRFSPSGNLDPTFAGNGIFSFNVVVVESCSAKSVAFQSNGDAIIGADAKQSTENVAGIVRVSSNGSLDTSFNNQTGTVLVRMPDASLSAVVTTSSDLIYVAGQAREPAVSTTNYLVVGLEAGGAPKPNFASSGTLLLDGGNNGADSGYALSFLGDNLLVGGFTTLSGKKSFGLAVITPIGAAGQFGGSGTVSTSMSSGEDAARAVLVSAPYVYVVGGADNDSNIAIARYTTSGNLDTAFATGGRLAISLPEGPVATRGAVMQKDGKIVIAGTVIDNGKKKIFVARFSP